VEEGSIDVDVFHLLVLMTVTVTVIVVVVVTVIVMSVVVTVVRVVVVVLSLVTLLVLQKGLLHFFVLNLLFVFVVAVGVSVTIPVCVVVVGVSMVMVVLVISTQVVVAVTCVQNFHLNQVENQPHDGYDKHYITFNLRRHEEALGGLDEEPESHNPDGGNGDESSDDLSSVPAVGQVLGRVFLRQSQREDRDAEAEHVGRQMGRVGINGDGACHVAADKLRRDEED